MKFKFVRRSSNTKTGPIPITMTERKSCSPSCPFKENGCYADYSHTRIHWDKIPINGIGLKELCENIMKLPLGQLWRHDVSGDLPHVGGHITKQLNPIIEANKGRRGFTYTHHDLNLGNNLAAVKYANENGFTINASCESVQQAENVIKAHGIPAVAVVHSEEKRKLWKTENGTTVIRCPATYEDKDTNCEKCRLCSHANRKMIIAFPAHGSGKRKVESVL